MLSGLGNPEACFLSGMKAFFTEHRGYNDLRRAAEGGHDAAAYLYAILLYRDNGGAAADDTVKGYMRWVAGDGSTRGVCLCVRRSRVRSTTRLGTFGVNHCRLRHRFAAISRVQAPAAIAAWKKDGFKFLCFAAKTIGCVAKWRSSHRE
jgi:TPR repeat protein